MRTHVLATVIVAAVLAACGKSQTGPQADPLVHTLTLPPEAAPDLPAAPGRDEVYANCLICHTLRYVALQPRFARKTWQAEVDKMKKAYGAPTSPEASEKIVNYLVATHGTE